MRRICELLLRNGWFIFLCFSQENILVNTNGVSSGVSRVKKVSSATIHRYVNYSSEAPYLLALLKPANEVSGL